MESFEQCDLSSWLSQQSSFRILLLLGLYYHLRSEEKEGGEIKKKRDQQIGCWVGRRCSWEETEEIVWELQESMCVAERFPTDLFWRNNFETSLTCDEIST